MKQIISIITLLLSANLLLAQEYWRETVDTVSAEGYYHIVPSQEICGLGLQTLKLVDGKGKEIPYLLRPSVPVKEMKQLEMYDLISNTGRDSVNTVVVHNKGGEVSRFYLQMKETDADKYVSIRGSNDQRQWFGVKQKSTLYSEYNSALGEIAIIDFPKGDYIYYELTVTNTGTSPLNITGVGKMAKSTIYGQFVELPTGGFLVAEDEYNRTVITFPALKYPYYLSKLEIKIDAKGYYSREGRIVGENRLEENIQLSSQNENTFYLNDILIDKKVQIIIENRNDPALQVKNVRLFGLTRYLCAYLDKNVPYYLEMNNVVGQYYDIQNFADQIPLNLPVIKTYQLEKEVGIVKPERTLRFFEKPLFLWGVIACVGLLLLLICVRMLNELRKRK